MAYAHISEDVREVAERLLTIAQLEVFRLECDGVGTMAIARRLGLTRSAVRDRIHNAHTKLERGGAVQDASGKWSMEKEVAA